MPSDCRCPGDAANDAIRALVDGADGGVWPAEEYEKLLLRWRAATQGDVAEAA